MQQITEKDIKQKANERNFKEPYNHEQAKLIIRDFILTSDFDGIEMLTQKKTGVKGNPFYVIKLIGEFYLEKIERSIISVIFEDLGFPSEKDNPFHTRTAHELKQALNRVLKNKDTIKKQLNN